MKFRRGVRGNLGEYRVEKSEKAGLTRKPLFPRAEWEPREGRLRLLGPQFPNPTDNSEMQTQDSLLDVIDRMQAEARLGYYPPAKITIDSDATGDERKAQAMDAVISKSPAQIYKGHLESALFEFPPRSRFTVEQLTGIVGRPPEGVHYNAVGAIINGMATRGLIRKTGRMVKAIRPGMHATEIAEWELVKYPERSAA